MPALTDARNAVWDAIENWSELKSDGNSVFKRRYKLNGDDAAEVGPRYEHLPALMLEYDNSPITQVLNKRHQVDASFLLRMWTADWNLENAELYELEIIKALFQSKSNGTTYIEVATNFAPQNTFTLEHERITVEADDENSRKAIETRIRFKLRVRFQAQ